MNIKQLREAIASLPDGMDVRIIGEEFNDVWHINGVCMLGKKPHLFTVDEAAELCRKPPSAIYWLCTHDKINCFHDGMQYRIPSEEVYKLYEQYHFTTDQQEID
jgi:hypothetical protein